MRNSYRRFDRTCHDTFASPFCYPDSTPGLTTGSSPCTSYNSDSHSRELDASCSETNDHLKNNANIDSVNRGRYIVEDVAVCSQCHTPRNSAGNLERGQWLEGAPLWLLPAQPTGDWPLQAPRIAGSPGGSDADMVRLLTTGVWRDGQRLRPPMPQFRMSREDAESVVAYLRSLTPSPH